MNSTQNLKTIYLSIEEAGQLYREIDGILWLEIPKSYQKQIDTYPKLVELRGVIKSLCRDEYE